MQTHQPTSTQPASRLTALCAGADKPASRLCAGADKPRALSYNQAHATDAPEDAEADADSLSEGSDTETETLRLQLQPPPNPTAPLNTCTTSLTNTLHTSSLSLSSKLSSDNIKTKTRLAASAATPCNLNTSSPTSAGTHPSGGSHASAYSLYWYTSTNTDAGGAGGARRVGSRGSGAGGYGPPFALTVPFSSSAPRFMAHHAGHLT